MTDKITFDMSDPRLWVKVYIPVLYDQRPRKLIFGSRNSAKSNFAAQYLIDRLLNEPTKAILVRKTYESIKDSQFDTIKSIVESYGEAFSSQFKFNVSPLEIRVRNGNKVVCRGMDKPDKAKSIRDPNFVWFEELDQLDYNDYLNTVLSIRGQGRNEHIGTFNAPRNDHWLTTKYLQDYEEWQRPDGMHTYVRKHDPKTMILHTNYLMNPHAVKNQQVMDEMDLLKELDYSDYQVQGLGLIGSSRTGQEFFGFFHRDRHVHSVDYNPNLAVHITFDFNNLPYSTCILSHVMNREVHIFDEITLPPPDNTIQDIAQTFFNRYPDAREAYIYGDPSGGASHQRKGREEQRSYFEHIKREFRRILHNQSDRVIRKAPPLAGRRMAWMELMAGNSGYTVLVNPRCSKTINDFETLKISDSGGWIKEKATDRKTGQSWEKNGHIADALTYQFAYIASDLFYPDRYR